MLTHYKGTRRLVILSLVDFVVPLLIALIFLVLVGFVVLFFYFNRIFSELREAQKQDPYLEFFKEMRGSVDENLRVMHDRLDRAAKVIAEFSEKAGGMVEIGRQIRDFQDLLRSPKLRGLVGEQQIEELLSQVLPPDLYTAQYEIKGVGKVDFVIDHPQGLVPIDAKYSLENFNRMVKEEDDDERERLRKTFLKDVELRVKETAKYISPENRTVEFALMFVPSDTVLYEIVKDEGILRVAQENRVLIVSPHIFWHFLRAVLLGLKGTRASEEAKRILALADALDRDIGRFGELLSTLEGHVGNTKNKMDEVSSAFKGLASRIAQLRFLGEREGK